MFKFLKITCNQAVTICNKSQYKAASVFDKIKLNIHFLRCKHCSLYTKQNVYLTKIFKKNSLNCKHNLPSLKEEEKLELKKFFRDS